MDMSYFGVAGVVDALVRNYPKININLVPSDAAALL